MIKQREKVLKISERKRKKNQTSKTKYGIWSAAKDKPKNRQEKSLYENDPNGNIDWKKEMKRKRKG
jgi:hypothetical protein